MKKMRANGRTNVTYAKAFDEMVADSMETMLTSGNVIEQLTEIKKRDAGLWEKIKEFFSDLTAKLKAVVSSYKDVDPDSVEGQTVRQMTDAIAELERLFTEGIADASENYRAAGETKKAPAKVKAETKADKKRSDRENEELDYNAEDLQAIKSFSKAIDEVLNCSNEYALNKTRSDTFTILENTPKIILDNVKGAKNLPIHIRFDALYLAARKDGALKGNYHNLGKNILENIHNNISDPDAIVRMNNGRINIFSNIQTEKGSTGVISIELDTPIEKNNSYKDRYNLVITIFAGKDNYIRNNLLKNGEYVEYEKSDLSQVNSQLHEWMAIINDKSLSDNSISQESDSVKKNFSDRDPDAVSTRQALVEALEATAKTDTEKELLADYKKELGLLGECPKHN